MSQNLKNDNQNNERHLTSRDINNDLLIKMEQNYPTKKKLDHAVYRIIPKMIQWLDSTPEDRYYTMTEIKTELSLNLSSAEIRKYIQIYREDAANEKFIRPKKSAITGLKYNEMIQFHGMIIANSTGYKFSRDPIEIEKYLTKSMEPRRVSLSKQTLSAENVLFEIRANKHAKKQWQGHETRREHGIKNN